MKIGDAIITGDNFCEHRNMKCTVVEIIEKGSYTMYKVRVVRTGIILVGFDWEFEWRCYE